jgi:cytochrome P450
VYIFKTATSFSFTFYELGRNAKFQQELYDHILEHYKPGEEELTYEHIENMNLLKATLKETLRIHGVVSVLGRQLQGDTVLDGYSVPKGV